MEDDPELLDKDAVLIFFNQIGVSEKTKTVLLKNGFDNFESLSYISRDVLAQLNIKNEEDTEALLSSLASIAECYRNSASMKEALNNYEKRVPGTIISPNLLMKWATNVKEKRRDKGGRLYKDNFLCTVTHLSLENRNITIIENLDLCINLKVLYLYDNKLTKIQGLDKWTKLTHLSLERNLISKMEGLDNLRELTKLYLEHNCISILEGLHTCGKLEELILSNQKLSPGQQFYFDDLSLWAISHCLQKIELKGCQLSDPRQLFYLERLNTLNLQNNEIKDFEDITPLLSTIQYLQTLDLRNNPLASVKKYRDQVVMTGLSIRMLDNKKVTDQERQYLLTLEMRKKGIKVPTKAPEFEMAGQRFRGKQQQPRKTAVKLPKGKKMTNLGDRPPVKAGLSIVGNEMEIHHALNDKENLHLSQEQEGEYRPQDQYPSYKQLMKQATLPSNIQINRK